MCLVEKQMLRDRTMSIKHVNAEVSGWCNQKCNYCFNDSGPRGERLDLGKWKKVLDVLSNFGLESVHLTGGEPFASKNIVDLIDYADHLGLKTTVLTNGFRVASLAEHYPYSLSKISHAQVSLDSLDPVTMTERRKNIDALDDALTAIDAFKCLNVPVEVSCVLDEGNVKGLDQVKEFCKLHDLEILIRNLELEGRAAKFGQILQDDVEKYIEDRYCYAPSSRLAATTYGIYTIESTGLISPAPILVNQEKCLTVNDLLRQAA